MRTRLPPAGWLLPAQVKDSSYCEATRKGLLPALLPFADFPKRLARAPGNLSGESLAFRGRVRWRHDRDPGNPQSGRSAKRPCAIWRSGGRVSIAIGVHRRPRRTLFVKKNFPSFGTSIICTLSESFFQRRCMLHRAADLTLSAAAWSCIRSRPAPYQSHGFDSPQHRRANSGAAAPLCCRSLWPAPRRLHSEWWLPCALRLPGAIARSHAVCFSGRVYCIASESALAMMTRDCASPSACFTSRTFCRFGLRFGDLHALFARSRLRSTSGRRPVPLSRRSSRPFAYSSGRSTFRSKTSFTLIASPARRVVIACETRSRNSSRFVEKMSRTM